MKSRYCHDQTPITVNDIITSRMPAGHIRRRLDYSRAILRFSPRRSARCTGECKNLAWISRSWSILSRQMSSSSVHGWVWDSKTVLLFKVWEYKRPARLIVHDFTKHLQAVWTVSWPKHVLNVMGFVQGISKLCGFYFAGAFLLSGETISRIWTFCWWKMVQTVLTTSPLKRLNRLNIETALIFSDKEGRFV